MNHPPNKTARLENRLEGAAARAAAAGWPVFPVRPRGKIPAVPDWDNAATTDLDQITAWWQATPWNIGISTGRAGLLVIDLDSARGAQPPRQWAAVRDGHDALTRLAATHGEAFPADTYTVVTPSGGTHLYFRQPAGVRLRNTQGALGWRIDTRGHGGYILAAGSRGTAGRRYRVRRDRPVAELPAWLIDALAPPADSESIARPPYAGHDAPPSASVRAHAYLRAVVDGERHAVTTAEVGHRHGTLLRAARRLGHWVGGGGLTEADARAALTDAARGYLGVAGYSARQIQRDITDGLTYGARHPRRLDDFPPARPSLHRP